MPQTWHSAHGCVVGMWFAGMPPVMLVANDTVEPWQVPHSPVVGCVAVVGRVTTIGVPTKLLPFSWQVAHVVPVTTLWTISVLALP